MLNSKDKSSCVLGYAWSHILGILTNKLYNVLISLISHGLDKDRFTDFILKNEFFNFQENNYYCEIYVVKSTKILIDVNG